MHVNRRAREHQTDTHATCQRLIQEEVSQDEETMRIPHFRRRWRRGTGERSERGRKRPRCQIRCKAHESPGPETLGAWRGKRTQVAEATISAVGLADPFTSSSSSRSLERTVLSTKIQPLRPLNVRSTSRPLIHDANTTPIVRASSKTVGRLAIRRPHQISRRG